MADAFSSFCATLGQPDPPAGLGLPLEALWWEAKGQWDKAHDCAQRDGGPVGAAVHAYLHRKEGDLDNARYWYARAARPVASGSLEAEWESLARALTERG